MTDITFKIMPFPRARSTLVVPVDDLEHGVKLGMDLLRVCLVASSLLLCKGCDLPELSKPYNIIYTAEGVPEDVQAELAQARQVIKAAGLSEITNADLLTGSDVWAQWIKAASQSGTLMRAGVPPKDLPLVLNGIATALNDALVVVDFAAGLIYAHDAPVDAVRRAAQAVRGYAIILSASAPPSDAWGYQPDGLALMRALKARWDPRSVLNPGAFAV
jgi:D-lactate dehydrogenase (cytochrome)